MKPTRLGILLGVTVLSGGVGFLIDLVLTSSGRPTFTPSWLLPVMLVLLGAALVVLAIPIRRSITGMSPEPVDPFRAVRILSLAKASAILGAVIGGLGIGLAVFLLSRPVAPSLGSMSAIVATIVAALALAVAALVTERLCTTGKDDDDEPPDRQSPDSASVTPIDPTATPIDPPATPIDPTATPEDLSLQPTPSDESGTPVASPSPHVPTAETAPPAAAPLAADAASEDGLLSPLSDASDLVVPDAPRAPEQGDVLDAGTFPTLREPRSERRLSIGDGTWHKISPKYVVSQFISGGILVVLVAAAMITVALTTGQWWPWLAGGALLAVTALPLVILPRQARAYGYQLRSDDIVFRRGILWQRFVAVPYGRLQLVDITHGPLDRAFKIAQLKLVTAAASTGVTIPGLTQDAAEALRDTLIDVAETRRTGL